MTVIGVIAAILLAAGLLPPYFEMWKRGGRCIGISMFLSIDLESLTDPIDFYFLGIDWMGAFISLMALGKIRSRPSNFRD